MYSNDCCYQVALMIAIRFSEAVTTWVRTRKGAEKTVKLDRFDKTNNTSEAKTNELA
jgi:hypothetical protein